MSPTWSYKTVQVPVPLVIVKVEPTFVQTPDALYATSSPEVAVAETVKLAPNTALAGAGVVTAIVWPASCAVTVAVTCGAAL